MGQTREAAEGTSNPLPPPPLAMSANQSFASGTTSQHGISYQAMEEERMRMKERRRYLAAKTKWNQTDAEMRRIKDTNEQAIHQEAKQMARQQRREEEYRMHKQVLAKKKADEQERSRQRQRLAEEAKAREERENMRKQKAMEDKVRRFNEKQAREREEKRAAIRSHHEFTANKVARKRADDEAHQAQFAEGKFAQAAKRRNQQMADVAFQINMNRIQNEQKMLDSQKQLQKIEEERMLKFRREAQQKEAKAFRHFDESERIRNQKNMMRQAKEEEDREMMQERKAFNDQVRLEKITSDLALREQHAYRNQENAIHQRQRDAALRREQMLQKQRTAKARRQAEEEAKLAKLMHNAELKSRSQSEFKKVKNLSTYLSKEEQMSHIQIMDTLDQLRENTITQLKADPSLPGLGLKGGYGAQSMPVLPSIDQLNHSGVFTDQSEQGLEAVPGAMQKSESDARLLRN